MSFRVPPPQNDNKIFTIAGYVKISSGPYRDHLGKINSWISRGEGLQPLSFNVSVIGFDGPFQFQRHELTPMVQIISDAADGVAVDYVVSPKNKPNLWGKVTVVDNNFVWVAWADPLFDRIYMSVDDLDVWTFHIQGTVH